ncbi:MAG TPA: class I fructose-bisphosphate aldolase, partial [Gaiellaceae bacterium]|nr:class I fructose-bisphosphate aldolase [Gaiellaceae bacterium]
TITEGLDGLRARLEEYRGLGVRFAKWRATYSIASDKPSEYCVWTNAHALARYAALCQEAGLVPIVEPEVLQDGTHTLEESRKATGRVLQAVYTELHDQRLDYRETLLKPNMVLSGYDATDRAGVQEVAEATLECFYKHVPAAVPGIVFLSGGQSDEDAIAPERDERAGAASVGAVVLVRPGSAGARAQGLGREAGERRGRTAGVLPPREDERRGAHGRVRAGDGDGRRRVASGTRGR